LTRDVTLSSNMAAPFPAPVKTWRKASYPAIEPSRPALSVRGQTVVITGAGSGIGRATASAFAAAGAAKLHLVGRRAEKLEETKVAVLAAAKVEVAVHVASVGSEDDVRKTAEEVGAWDVFVSNAGFLAAPGPMRESSTQEWWEGFEVGSPAHTCLFAGGEYTPAAERDPV
jgi:NAD(P)-dependent dehydrogenase (short-subunit alcohol dehydrogenase family)